MKNNLFLSKYYSLILITIVSCLTLFGCFKDTSYHSNNEENIYMPQAVGEKGLLTVNVQSAPQYFTYGAAYGGTETIKGDIIVTFEVANDLIDSVNTADVSSYLQMPDGSYSLSSLTDTIKNGISSSSGQVLTINASQLDIYTKGVKYMLPIRITHVSAGHIDTTYNTAYFKIDSLIKPEEDITSVGSLSVNIENINGSNGANNSEGSSKLVDNNTSTKFLIYNYVAGEDFWWKLTLPTAQIVNIYTITSANDASSRDIKDWEFQGSNDGTIWEVLDKQTDQYWDARSETRRFEIENNTAYKYYRLNVLNNGGSTLIQVAEWRLLKYVIK